MVREGLWSPTYTSSPSSSLASWSWQWWWVGGKDTSTDKEHVVETKLCWPGETPFILQSGWSVITISDHLADCQDEGGRTKIRQKPDDKVNSFIISSLPVIFNHHISLNHQLSLVDQLAECKNYCDKRKRDDRREWRKSWQAAMWRDEWQTRMRGVKKTCVDISVLSDDNKDDGINAVM